MLWGPLRPRGCPLPTAQPNCPLDSVRQVPPKLNPSLWPPQGTGEDRSGVRWGPLRWPPSLVFLAESSEDRTGSHVGICWLVASTRELLSLPAPR